MYSCWFQRVKDKEFESNSQRVWVFSQSDDSWFQRVKDKEFESNSQLERIDLHSFGAGFSVSKIKNLKAIHNGILTNI